MTSTKPIAYSYIRFSTPEQKKGDSERRQIEAAEQYANEHGLKLDSSMSDRGLSAYHGTHRSKGDLGKFLGLVEAGKIAKGSMLIIENFDRLSRENPDEVLNLFLSIIRSGITLVTLSDERQFTPDSINENMGDLYIAIGEIYRAHKESERKSEMLSDAWKQKRKQAANGGKKLTSVSPKWLEPVKDEQGDTIDFKIREEPAKAIREIFKLKRDGFGNTKIAKKLNEDNSFWQPPKSNRSSGGWRESYIQKIIHNKAVIGEYQPHKKIDGKREPVKDENGNDVVISDYYPAVVEEDLFRAVHNQLARYRKKNGHPGGRTGKQMNPFQGIVYCKNCGGPMHHINKGSGPKAGHGRYLRCDFSRRTKTDEDGNRICSAKGVPYGRFKDRFFKFVQEVNISALLPNPDEHQARLEQLEQTIEANVHRIQELERKESNLTDSIADGDSPELRNKLKKQLEKVISERAQIIEENEELTRQLAELSKEADKLKDSRDNIAEYNDLLESAENEEEEKDLRIKMRQEIRRIISRIEVHPSNETIGRFESIVVWFYGSEPHGKLISLTEDGWKVLTRQKAPKKTA